MQHFRAGGLGDVVLGPNERWVPGSWEMPAAWFAQAMSGRYPPEPPPPPRNPALRLVTTGSGMTAAEWEAWLKEPLT